MGLSGFTHMVPDPLVTTRLYERILSYLTEHLQAPRQSAFRESVSNHPPTAAGRRVIEV